MLGFVHFSKCMLLLYTVANNIVISDPDNLMKNMLQINSFNCGKLDGVLIREAPMLG